MSSYDEDKTPWWWPCLADSEWCERSRKEYFEEGYHDTEEWTDEYLLDKVANGWKYVTTWDNVKDAMCEYVELADVFLKLVEKHGYKPEDFNDFGEFIKKEGENK